MIKIKDVLIIGSILVVAVILFGPESQWGIAEYLVLAAAAWYSNYI